MALAIGGVALVSFGVLAIIGRVAQYDRVIAALKAADHAWLAMAAAGLGVAFVGYALSYTGFAGVSDGPRIPFTTGVRVSVAAAGAGALASAAGTLAVGFWAIHREGVSVTETTRRVLALSTYQWFVLGWAAVVSGVVLLVGDPDRAPLAMEVAWFAVVPLATLIGMWASSPRRAARSDSWDAERAASAAAGRRGRLVAMARGGYAEAIGGLVLMRAAIAAPRRNIAALAGFPVYWTGQIAIVWAALQGLGAQIPLPALVLAFATGYVASGIPLPAGAGGVEAGLSFALAAVGVDLADAVLATLLFRFFTLWLPLVPALIVAPTFRRDHPAPEPGEALG